MRLALLALLLAGCATCPTQRTRCGPAGPEVCASGAWVPISNCAEAGDGWRCRVVDSGVAACLP